MVRLPLFLFLAVAIPTAVMIASGETHAFAPPATAFQSSLEDETARPVASGSDSASLHSDARAAQARFERIRIRHSRLRYGLSAGTCDERVGRMCIRLPSGNTESDWEPPPEPDRIVEAREVLLGELEEVGSQIPGDAWVLGQRVAYLGEAGRWADALSLARRCSLAPASKWWCDALEGKALHRLGRFVEAEAAFELALAAMPEDDRREWPELDRLVEPELHRLFRDAEPDSLAVLEARLWALANPLYMVPGNDRRSEHFTRLTLARIRSDARSPYAMSWGSDLAEILVRYGPEAAYEREPSRPLATAPDAVTGRFDPHSRRFLPDEEVFLDPVAVVPGDWRTDERRARSRHAPSYAPRIGLLDVRQALFRRGDDMLVVLDWELGEGRPRWEPGEDGAGIEAGLVLLHADDLSRARAQTDVEWEAAPDGGPRGVATALVPVGRYLVSLELLDPDGGRAWRARHGAAREAIPRGVVALSDLVLLTPEEPGPTGPELPACAGSIEDELGRLVLGSRLDGRMVEVAWEMYGLEPGDGPLRFRLSAAREDGGLLRRAGQFLGIVARETPIEIRWEEGVPEAEDGEAGAPLLRCVALDLSSLEAGAVRLQLTVELPGRTEIRAERIVELTGG